MLSLYLGIDWSKNKHDVVAVNHQGAVIARLTIAHSPEGFAQLDQLRQDLGVTTTDCGVGLETAHNLLVDFLWARGYEQLYVIPPTVTRSARGRYRQSGARTDQSDALVIANLLRTDLSRLYPWQPDQPATRQLRTLVSQLAFLTRQSVRLSNRLQAVLWRYYPAATLVFDRLDQSISLAFIQRYPTPQAATQLTLAEFTAFARQHNHYWQSKIVASFARLQQPQPQPDPALAEAYQAEALLLAQLLRPVVEAKKETLRAIKHLYQAHPDYPIFASLPGLGWRLGPALLTKFGDDRRRFPTATSLQALAGTCPVTHWSGKRKSVRFRRACDHHFRGITQQWAAKSLLKSLWANSYYHQVRPHCHSHNHALRCLANRWLAIAWTLWQRHETYDEAYHLQQRQLRAKP
jgi:transposase